jgi:hypothetical protein
MAILQPLSRPPHFSDSRDKTVKGHFLCFRTFLFQHLLSFLYPPCSLDLDTLLTAKVDFTVACLIVFSRFYIRCLLPCLVRHEHIGFSSFHQATTLRPAISSIASSSSFYFPYFTSTHFELTRLADHVYISSAHNTPWETPRTKSQSPYAGMADAVCRATVLYLQFDLRHTILATAISQWPLAHNADRQ